VHCIALLYCSTAVMVVHFYMSLCMVWVMATWDNAAEH